MLLSNILTCIFFLWFMMLEFKIEKNISCVKKQKQNPLKKSYMVSNVVISFMHL